MGRGERISNRTTAGLSWNIPSQEGSSKTLDQVSKAHGGDTDRRGGEKTATRPSTGVLRTLIAGSAAACVPEAPRRPGDEARVGLRRHLLVVDVLRLGLSQRNERPSRLA